MMMMQTRSLCANLLAFVSLGTALVACGGQALDVGSNGDRGFGGEDSSPGGEPGTGARAGTGTGGSAGAPSPMCPCSRRPGVNNSFQCARGVDESASASLGPDGGVLALEGQQGSDSGVSFQLDAPPNALTAEVEVRLIETSLSPPADLVDYSPVYLLQPTELSSRYPMKLTIPFGNGDGSYSGLKIYAAETVEGPFEPLADSYMNAGFMQGSTTRLGAFLVAAPRSAEQAACP